MRQLSLLLWTFLLIPLSNVAPRSAGHSPRVTQLPLSLNILEIKIKDNRDVDVTGEFHFWRKMRGVDVRLPLQGEISRKKNEFVYPTDSNLISEPFWKISWQETGTTSRLIEFDAWEDDPWPDDDDYLGIVRTTLDLTTFEFATETSKKLETGDFHIVFEITCAPPVSSISHPDSGRIYEKSFLNLKWAPIMPAIGIRGYSYELDQDPQTSPDAPLEGTHTSLEYTLVPSATAQTYWFHVRAQDKAGFWSTTTHFKLNTGSFQLRETTGITTTTPSTTDFSLSAYPNPFNSSLQITYQLKIPGAIELQIFNIKGQRVRLLLQMAHAPGNFEITWDARNDAGESLPSGLYLAVLRVNNEFLSRKITLIR